MRILSKVVAAVVAVALSAAPLLAAIPCPGKMAPAAHCAGCCPMMANGMAGEMAMTMGAPSDSDAAAVQVLDQFEQPPCCTASSSDTAVPAILRGVQGPLTASAAAASGSALPSLLPAPLHALARPLPDHTGRSRVFSLLCTFRI